MERSCVRCSARFSITDADFAFLEKVSPVFGGKKELIPPPAMCPACRQQRRLAFRNERRLYHRKSDLSGRQIISMYSPDKPYTVYDQQEWWGDGWDGTDYGREIDWNRPFFAQFGELMRRTPRISLINGQHENSEYCNFAFKNKDSYLLFTTGECQDSYYTNRGWKLKDCCDCSSVEDCELCYEVIDSADCHNCKWLQNCSNCSDCTLGYGLQGCSNCFACYGLQRQSYCIGNKQYSKEEYAKTIAALSRDMDAVRRNFEARKLQVPRKAIEGTQNEASTGDRLQHCSDARECFEGMHLKDCARVCNATHLTDVQDLDNGDRSQLVYQAVGDEQNYGYLFGDICWFNRNILYCSLCFRCEDCFGCSGLRGKKHCIFNKQYSKEEYEALVPRIIAHMRATGEWGEFFPAELSPYGYDETMAQDYYPLTETEAKAGGWRWAGDPERESYKGPRTEVPARIEDAGDDICQRILTCAASGRPYKITPRELSLYRKLGVPVPALCFEERYRRRSALRNPRTLFDRTCAKCRAPIRTTYAPERPETVYCEKCYLEAVH